MTIALKFQAIARRPSPVWPRNVLRMSPWRSFSSSASMLNDTLPLSGVRVLDMTRVLAGVSQVHGAFPLIYTNWSDLQPYCTQILGDLGYVEQLELILAISLSNLQSNMA